MKTIEQRAQQYTKWGITGLQCRRDMDVQPIRTAAAKAIETGNETVSLALANRKRAKTVKLSIGVTATVTGRGSRCEAPADTVLAACDAELAAIEQAIARKAVA